MSEWTSLPQVDKFQWQNYNTQGLAHNMGEIDQGKSIRPTPRKIYMSTQLCNSNTCVYFTDPGSPLMNVETKNHFDTIIYKTKYLSLK